MSAYEAVKVRGGCHVTEPHIEEALALTVIPHSDDYPSSDPRWRSEVTSLIRGLEQRVPVEQRTIPTEGTKFGVVELIAVLGSAGAISAAVQSFQAWLKRDRSRHLTLTWEIDGQEGRIELDGQAASDESARQMLTGALEQLTGRGR
jgi:Effector Associated Constant Component 1